MKKILTVLLVFTSISLANQSCLIDPVKQKCDGWEANDYFEETIEALQLKAQEFLNNPNKTTCLAYKNAYLDYLDELKEWKVCYDYHGLGEAYETHLEATEQTINNLDCDQF